jgi:hypothetical protein
MSPATQSMLSTLPPHRTAMGSAVSNSTRNLGTVLGVAVIGSVASSVYNGRMHGTSLAAAVGVAQARPGDAGLAAAVGRAASAFVHGADVAALVAAAVAVAAVPLALRYLPKRVHDVTMPHVDQDRTAEMSVA